MRPAAVVIRSPAPGIVRDPGQAAGAACEPVPVVVRTPADGDVRTPRPADAGRVDPAAVRVEIVRPVGETAIHVAVVVRAVTLGAFEEPALEIVSGSALIADEVEYAFVVDRRRLTFAQTGGSCRCTHFDRSVEHGDAVAAARIGFDRIHGFVRGD